MYFDEVFEFVGGAGVYQISLLMYVFALCLVSVDAIRMNFIGGHMDHWCRMPALENFTHQQQKYIGIPDSSSEGSTKRGHTFLSSFLGIDRGGGGDGDEGVENVEYEMCYRVPLDYGNYTRDELLNWNRTLMTGDVSRSEWVRCDGGWVFDQSQFISTIGSKVRWRWTVADLDNLLHTGSSSSSSSLLL